MECLGNDENNQLLNIMSNTKFLGSTENFQKFIYELFEKHGILNDLRAYLRGHIVNVLKTADTGDMTSCQKNFTQRLEFKYQALNILIAEYLLRQEFNYTLSVFVSEIPLANMIFEFTKALFKNSEASNLNFGDSDVWSILSCLGIECDSEHASKIVEMYKSENMPLLLCIFKCTPLCNKESIVFDNTPTSEENLTSDKSVDSFQEGCKENDKQSRKCRHYSYCKTCQYRVLRIKDRYGRRKARFNQMFDQLKSVYESEVEMMKEVQESRIQKSIASHAIQLQKHKDELEESFKERESELFKNIDEKKKFLWNLVKSLRQQHDAMSKAMDDVKSDTERLNAKELNLKAQLQEAEDLRKRGDDVRIQISEKLQTLDQHLQTMKNEREKLEILKKNYNERDVESEKKEYDSLKNELQVLKQFVEAANVKCSAEKGTATDNCMNNEQNGGMNIVNDLKQKDINSASNNGIYRDFQRANSSLSSDRDQSDRELCDHNRNQLYNRDFCDRTSNELQRLKSENHRLNILARQQSDHIASLASERSRLRTDFTYARPQTAPTLLQPFARSINTNNVFGSTIGGGEQIDLLPERPRVFIPSDALPFIGVLKDRHTDNRRHLINQWRSLRRRVTPQVATSSKLLLKDRMNRQEEPGQTTDLAISSNQNNEDNIPTCSCNVCNEQTRKQRVSKLNTDWSKQREKSPKSVLREAKEKLRNNHSTKEPPPIREKSPITTLREAKMRLRKLEIEAEAVERSYQDFRRKQQSEAQGLGKQLDVSKSKSLHKLEESCKTDEKNNHEANDFVRQNFDTYLKRHPTFSIPAFKNKNAMSEMIKPIPISFSNIEQKNCNRLSMNYLETPLTEFRKLYRTKNKSKVRCMNVVDEDAVENPDTLVNKTVELEILKDNINKIFNFAPNTPKSDRDVALVNIPEDKVIKDFDETEQNLLRIDIENCETNSIKVDSDKVLLVESSINTKEISDSEVDEKDKISTHMTILVSPKVNSGERVLKSPEVEKITENDRLNALFNSENKDLSSVDVQLEELSKRNSTNDKDTQDEYPDDFSADVDNFNSRSDYGESPISLAKDSEHFWET